MPEVERIKLIARTVIAMGARDIEFKERLSQCLGDLTFVFNYRGKEVDLHVAPCAKSVAERINAIPTPIDSPVMDQADNVFAHPCFEEHVKMRWFVPQNVNHTPVKDFNKNMRRRYERLRGKIKGLWMPSLV